MTTKTKILIGILVIGVVLIGGWWILNDRPLPKVGQPPKPEVAISTDKTEYRQGETIRVTVRNGLDVPILYFRIGDGRFWGIEYLGGGKWKNPDYERGGGFQLTEKNINDVCDIALYEIMPPIKMKANSMLSQQWNQRICPFEAEHPGKPRLVKYIGAGHYRLIFAYGFETSDLSTFKDWKVVYSNEFTIK